jgi:dihydropteroate synthase
MVKIVGILNITPDSFFDGGKYFTKDLACKQVTKLMQDGADIIDIGAESTKPNATALTDEQELARLEMLPQIIAMVADFNKKMAKNIQTSIDSYHYQTIAKAVDCGIDIVNDISGLVDRKIIDLILSQQVKVIFMHNLAIHAKPNLIVNPNLNINNEIISWAKNKIDYLLGCGLKKEQLIFDPGIGFSKNALQSIRILKNINEYRILNVPILVGHSNKSFLDSIDSQYSDRHNKTLEISRFLINNKVDYLRVHDVSAHSKIINNT